MKLPPRSARLGELLDVYLVSAVAAVILLRAFLAASGYPQLGGGGLHIAHVLWGGLGMALSIGILLSFLSERARLAGAIIGGAGFGTFIDELGKFLTSNNDYFFRPAVALIYVIFVVCFLTAGRLRPGGGLSSIERMTNAIEILKGAAARDLDPRELDRASALLAEADGGHPLVPRLRRLLQDLPSAPHPDPLPERAWSGLQSGYTRVVSARWFRWGLVAVFALQAAGTVLGLTALAAAGAAAALAGPQAPGHDLTLQLRADGTELAGWIAALVAGGFTVTGIGLLRRSRLRAYRALELAVLVDLLLAQPVSLLSSQLGALGGVLVDLVLLAGLRYLLGRERALHPAAAPVPAPERPPTSRIAPP